MSLHKLTAGDGYTYLIRQVAAQDATERGTDSLESYYSAKGEAPGHWWGRGLDGLDVSGTVTEQQMRNLFGEGLHPNADQLIEQALTELPHGGRRREQLRHLTKAGRLGRPFPVYPGDTPWRARLGLAYLDTELGVRRPLTEAEKSQIRTQVATDLFTELHGRPPGTGQELSGFLAAQSRAQTSAVAGYDLTFSPVKSVSALWAVAPLQVSAQIEAAHADAVQQTLQWLETEAGYTREGTRGVAQVETTGLIGAVFTHRDSRAGDPDLHTHVAVSNKVQTRSGKWLALDGRMLHRMAVAASERYNTLLEAGITERIGGTFQPRQQDVPGRRPVRELVGVPTELIQRWSSRRESIEAKTEQLHAKFLTDHGRVPTAVERIGLAQQATLATRQAKHEPRSLAQQRAAWHTEAVHALGGEDRLAAVLQQVQQPPDPDQYRPVTRQLLTGLTEAVVQVTAEHRGQWRWHNLAAEALRQARAAGVDPAQAASVAAQVTDLAAGGEHCLPIGADTDPVDTAHPVPPQLQRSDGSSVFRMARGQLFTSPAVLHAEQRILAQAALLDGRTLAASDIDIAALEWSANNDGRVLNTGQQALVHTVATTGRRVQLALAPAGTGKTTAMGVLAAAWRASGGTVLGLAPQASAAQELSAAIPGVHADTLDKLVHDLRRLAPSDRAPWIGRVDADTLVIIDEAGLASTPKLDTAISYITGRGGRVLLVGDDQQRAAAGAGGLLRDLEAVHGAVTLTEVLRFTDPVLGHASLALRAGDPSVAGFYADRGELHAATPDTAADQAFTAWAADTAAGADSVMIAPTLDMVGALNARARAARAAAGALRGPHLTLPNGENVAAGDVIITKRNKRSLSLGGTDFVRNNYRWTVTAVHPDGSLRAVETVRQVERTIPAWYVQQGFVRLGYAHTAASVQGMTVGSPTGRNRRRGTAHVVVADGMTRNDLYPALTRAVDGSHAYVITPGTGDPHDVVTPGAVTPPTPVEVFAGILARDGSARSVTTELRHAADPTHRLGPAADAYLHAVTTAAETVLGPDRLAALTDAAEQAAPGVTDAAAWDTLRGHLAVLELSGRDAAAELAAAAAARELDTAGDPAATLDWRLDPTGNHSQHAGPVPRPLPWLPAIPHVLAANLQWGDYLHARRQLVDDLAGQIRQQVRVWTVDAAPAWAMPYLPDRDVTADLAVWRAAHSTPTDDPRPAGDKPQRIAEQQQRRHLIDRAVTVAGDPADGADRWADMLAHAGVNVTSDDYWPVIAGRLSLAETAGLPVRHLLDHAIADRTPLPTEGTAGALWWRLAPHISADSYTPTPAGHRLRPPWVGRLQHALGREATDRILTDRLWPTIVGAVDSYARTPAATVDGHRPEQIAADAAQLLAAACDTVRPHEQAAVLLWHIGTLTDPQPPDPHHEPDAPDPDEADRRRPADADQLLGDPDLDPGTDRSTTRTVPPVDDTDPTLDPAADPFNLDLHTADAAAIDAQHATHIHDLVEPDEYGPVDDQQDRPVDGDDALPTPDDDPLPPPPAEPDRFPTTDHPVLADVDEAAQAAALDRSRAALTAAAAFYHQQAAGSWVPRYLAGRGLATPAAADFGHAPAAWTATRDHLHGLGFSDTELLAAGLVQTTSRGGIVDRLRDRAVTPITTPDGQVAGFIGRKNPSDTNTETPKYLNTPTTALYDKSRLLYGLTPDAVAALRDGADLVIVEGPMDAAAVNAAHREPAGHHPAVVAVAPCGTALTAEHLATLDAVTDGRLTARQIVVAFDQDTAGRAAAVRAHQLLAHTGIHDSRGLLTHPGKDLADLLADAGPDTVRDAVNDRRQLTDLVVDDTLEQVRAHTFRDRPGGHTLTQAAQDITFRVQAFQALERRLAGLPDHAVQRQAARIADQLGMQPIDVLDRLTYDRRATAATHATVDDPRHTDPGVGDIGGNAGDLAAALRLPEPPVLSSYGQAVLAAAHGTAPAADNHAEPAADLVPAAAHTTPEPRPYAGLPDAVLNREIDAAHAQRAVTELDLPDAIVDLERIRSDVARGDGPATAELKRVHLFHRERVEQIRTLQDTDAQARDIAAQIGRNAGQRSHAEGELAQLGAFSGRRKAELRQRLLDLQASDEQLHARIIQARERVSPFRDQLGTPEQQQQHLDAAKTHHAELDQLRARAAEHDQQAVHRAARLVDQLRTHGQQADQRWHHLTAERRYRAEHPEQPGADERRTAAYDAALRRRDTDEPKPDMPCVGQPQSTPNQIER
ncbi:MobF family relaxase [Nakamurella endophytica]|uniref:Toprim domain-containing protein n=1 Tax=Nakamurella endophytica TaxID=1748367 RepID=A0A917WM76_9ACTN|nr:MobF family relaxase [Nakamurella endophytica]GGM15830.1 hypothetical protein GCM10011594_39850 [Nakamurella endophytica]